ncbi:MAG: nuclear transport factor 2 family protein [Bryobacterales bacterium]|nr:nuclear transport factor 2 family protein [Bryobacterales bacterium]
MLRLLLVTALAGFAALAADPAVEIKALLDEQAAAWNRGDIPAFMKSYENSPATTYAGASGVTKGYTTVLERYRKRYPDRDAMGTLRFTNIEVRLLGKDHALATGKFNLQRTPAGGGPASGWFSLVLKRDKGSWLVIHDHTS